MQWEEREERGSPASDGRAAAPVGMCAVFFFAGRDERRCWERKAERKEHDTRDAGSLIELWEEIRYQKARARLEFLVGWQRQRKKMR